MVIVVKPLPLAFFAEIVYVAVAVTTVGVPVITPLVLSVKPVGSAVPITAYEVGVPVTVGDGKAGVGVALYCVYTKVDGE